MNARAGANMTDKEIDDLLWDDTDDDEKEDQQKKRQKEEKPLGSKKEAKYTTPRTNHAEQTLFRVATYNIWFQADVSGRQRMHALAQSLLNQPSLYFIGFQEVIDPLQTDLFARLQHDYRIVRQPVTDVPYYCAVAVHKSLTVLKEGFVPFTVTRMGRGWTYVKAQTNDDGDNKTLVFTTSHLESYTGKNPFTGKVETGSEERQQQIREWEEWCQQQDCDVIIMTGDLNWDDERVRSVGTDPCLLDHLRNKTWRDVWIEEKQRSTAAQHKALQYTYDAKVSPMLSGNLRRRFDRILVRKHVSVTGMELIGKEALPGCTWTKTNPFNQSVKTVPVTPSDHFGLVATLSLPK